MELIIRRLDVPVVEFSPAVGLPSQRFLDRLICGDREQIPGRLLLQGRTKALVDLRKFFRGPDPDGIRQVREEYDPGLAAPGFCKS